jgi:hypothetical protein
MGTKFVAVALEGDFRDRLGEIAQVCGKAPVGNIQFFSNWGDVVPFTKKKG